MAARTIPALAPRSVAKAATRVSHSKLTGLPARSHSVPQFTVPLEEQPAPFAPGESLGAMRGLAAVMVAYLVIAAVALGGILAWHVFQ
uniref:Uncharacterized protein n=1 Tax=Acidobacterium capsulatum TaxID=33075 RepID=A0A7V5CU15_9BACT